MAGHVEEEDLIVVALLVNVGLVEFLQQMILFVQPLLLRIA